jgi:predicted dienelactone hydrolase
VSRKIGVFLGLIAAAGVAFGGYTAMNERGSGTGPPAA